MKNINILGQQYKIKSATAKTDSKLVNVSGYIEFHTKEIVLDESNYENDYNTVKDYSSYKRNTLRHEIVHAFLYESGLKELSNNEIIVDWVAMQFPKLMDAFIKLGIEK